MDHTRVSRLSLVAAHLRRHGRLAIASVDAACKFAEAERRHNAPERPGRRMTPRAASFPNAMAGSMREQDGLDRAQILIQQVRDVRGHHRPAQRHEERGSGAPQPACAPRRARTALLPTMRA